jgi:hypothetical protein
VRPPEEIARLVTAPRHLNATLTDPSPDRRWMLREVGEAMPSVNTFGRQHHYFAGLQVDPKANRSRVLTNRGAAGLEMVDLSSGRSVKIETPAGATVSGPVWSPDGSQVAYIANFDAASHVFVADVATGKSRQVTKTPLLATLVTSVAWTADSKSIVTVLIPEPRPAMPVRPAVATGPKVRLWMDSLESSQRNWATLLEEPFDQDLMAYYVTGQLAIIQVGKRSDKSVGAVKPVGAVTTIGAPAMISAVDPSPDGRWLKVTRMDRPFSYMVQYDNFGTVDEIWDLTGKVVATVAQSPIREATDSTSVAARAARDSAKRAIAWLPSGDGISWIGTTPKRNGADTAETGAEAAAGSESSSGARRSAQRIPPSRSAATGRSATPRSRGTRSSSSSRGAGRERARFSRSAPVTPQPRQGKPSRASATGRRGSRPWERDRKASEDSDRPRRATRSPSINSQAVSCSRSERRDDGRSSPLGTRPSSFRVRNTIATGRLRVPEPSSTG